MITPTLLLGARSGGIFRFDDTYQDNGQDILLRLRTAEVALAGIGGRIAFQRLYVAVSFTCPFTLRVTPIVDGKPPLAEYADLSVSAADFTDPTNFLLRHPVGRNTYLFEVALTLPYLRNSIERFRYAMQGCYFQVQIEQVAPLPELGELIVESVELQYKVLTRSSVQ